MYFIKLELSIFFLFLFFLHARDYSMRFLVQRVACTIMMFIFYRIVISVYKHSLICISYKFYEIDYHSYFLSFHSVAYYDTHKECCGSIHTRTSWVHDIMYSYLSNYNMSSWKKVFCLRKMCLNSYKYSAYLI
jgi:hypothetical protein